MASAPSLFQRVIENILQGLPGVSVYIDDILVTGKTLEDHLKNWKAVLTRLDKAGLAKAQMRKVSFYYLL